MPYCNPGASPRRSGKKKRLPAAPALDAGNPPSHPGSPQSATTAAIPALQRGSQSATLKSIHRSSASMCKLEWRIFPVTEMIAALSEAAILVL